MKNIKKAEWLMNHDGVCDEGVWRKWRAKTWNTAARGNS